MTNERSSTRARFMLAVIIVVAAALRLYGAAHGNLMYDETIHLAAAMTIGTEPAQVPFAWHSVDHPMMSVNLLRLSSILFGDTNIGLRVLHLAFGTALVGAIFLVARQAFNTEAALWAACLAAVDQFLVTWSYFAVPEILLLFFGTVSLWQFLVVLARRRTVNFVLTGVFIGLAYLAKETAIFFMVALWLTLLVHRDWRAVLWDWRWYLAHLVALMIVLPDVVWNLSHRYESYFARDHSMLGSGLSFNLEAADLFVGELRGGLRDSFDFAAIYNLQSPAQVHWPAGFVYLAAVALGLRWWQNHAVRPLVLTFAFVLGVIVVLPFHQVEWWWPSMAVPPAIVLGGSAIERLVRFRPNRRVLLRAGHASLILVLCALSYLTIRAAMAAGRIGQNVPRVSAERLVELAVAHARSAVTRTEIRALNWSLTHTLHVAGAQPALVAHLARVACAREELDRARYFARRALQLDSTNAIAADVTARLAAGPPCWRE